MSVLYLKICQVVKYVAEFMEQLSSKLNLQL